MTRARSLLLAAALLALAAAASAPPPAPPTTASAKSPPTPASPDAKAADPTNAAKADADVDEYETWAIFTTKKNPWTKLVVPVSALLAIVVIALFVVRWRKTGELPGPPVAP